MKIKLTFALAVLVIFQSSSVYSGEDWKQRLNIPSWANNIFNDKSLENNFKFLFDMNPFYLRGDFNGDDQPDIAIWVRKKSSNKIGILVIHRESKNIFILGAGTSIGNGGDNFDWLTNWAVKRKERVVIGAGENSPLLLKGEAIFVEKRESASAIIYWDGKAYKWYQQGD